MKSQDAEKWFDEHENELIEDICRLVRIPSVSVKTDDPGMPYGPACKQVLDTCLALGQSMGFETFNHENYCGTFLWRGKRTSEIGIFGHADVVPAGDGWNYEPYEPTLENGLIIGRGAADNKGSMLAALYALRYLKENGYEPEHSVRFFFGCSEETGMEDLEYYASHYEEPVFSLVADFRFPGACGEKGMLEIDAESRIESSVLTEFTAGTVSNAVPGYAEAVLCIERNSEEGLEMLKRAGAEVKEEEKGIYRISMSGISTHAAFPEGSDSAEVKLAEALLGADVLDDAGSRLMKAIINMFGDYYGKGLHIDFSDPQSGKLTHVGGMADYKNGIFHQNINIRYNVTADYALLLERIQQALLQNEFKLVCVKHSGPSYIDPELPVIRKMTEIANRVLKTDLQPFVIGGGTYARKLKRAIAYGMGMPVRSLPFGKSRGGAHQADEYVELEDLKKAFVIYAEALPEIDIMIEK